MATDDAFRQLDRHKYIRLTTFRRDGTPVQTAVWLVPEAGRLLVLTANTTGKVKRLAHTSRVLIAPSDARGRVADGVQDVAGTAEVIDDPAEVERLGKLITARYGLFGRLVDFGQKYLRRNKAGSVEIRISPAG